MSSFSMTPQAETQSEVTTVSSADLAPSMHNHTGEQSSPTHDTLPGLLAPQQEQQAAEVVQHEQQAASQHVQQAARASSHEAPAEHHQNTADTFDQHQQRATDANPEYIFDSDSTLASTEVGHESESDDEDSDDDEEIVPLTHETIAKMMMAGGADDEDEENNTGQRIQPRTANEVEEENIVIPDLAITQDMNITELGKIENIVENRILVTGSSTGEYQAVEPGAVVCTEQRQLVGVLADLFGPVRQPWYSIAFKDTEGNSLIASLNLEPGNKLCFVNDHAKFVFTARLRDQKHTDASNLYDEEVNERDMEFSDDEKEAEHKRQQKLAKQAARDAGNARQPGKEGYVKRQQPQAFSNQDQARPISRGNDAPTSTYSGGLNYDDDDDGPYKILKRPDNLTEMMAIVPPSRSDRGRGGVHTGRGDRGSRVHRGGRAGRAGRGGARAGLGFQQQQRPGTTFPPSMPPTGQMHAQQTPQTYQFNGQSYQYGVGAAQQPGPPYPAAQPHATSSAQQWSTYATTSAASAYPTPQSYATSSPQQWYPYATTSSTAPAYATTSTAPSYASSTTAPPQSYAGNNQTGTASTASYVPPVHYPGYYQQQQQTAATQPGQSAYHQQAAITNPTYAAHPQQTATTYSGYPAYQQTYTAYPQQFNPQSAFPGYPQYTAQSTYAGYPQQYATTQAAQTASPQPTTTTNEPDIASILRQLQQDKK